MEHFDQRDGQALLEAQRNAPREPSHWIARATPAPAARRGPRRGWDWTLIEPVLMIASEDRWSVLAANLTSAELRAELTQPAPLAPQAAARLARSIELGVDVPGSGVRRKVGIGA
jgi:hypothetical protein